MEFWARWAHQALWHASLWNMHEVSRTGLGSSFFWDAVIIALYCEPWWEAGLYAQVAFQLG
jgi:hypothetical protein